MASPNHNDDTKTLCLTFSCGGTSISIQETFSSLQERDELLPRKTNFIVDETFFLVLVQLLKDAAIIRNEKASRRKWTQFKNDLKAATKAHDERLKNKQVSKMPSFDSFRKGHYTIDADGKPVQGSDEIVSIEKLLEYHENWKSQDSGTSHYCECMRFQNYCIENTTFSKDFMEIFINECGHADKQPVEKGAKRKRILMDPDTTAEIYLKSPPKHATTCPSVGTSRQQREDRTGTTAASANTSVLKDIRLRGNIQGASEVTNCNNLVTNTMHFNFSSPSPQKRSDPASRYVQYKVDAYEDYFHKNEIPFPCMGYNDWLETSFIPETASRTKEAFLGLPLSDDSIGLMSPLDRATSLGGASVGGISNATLGSFGLKGIFSPDNAKPPGICKKSPSSPDKKPSPI